MAHEVDTHEGRDTALEPSAGQENEEQPCAVKEDKESEADEAHHGVALLGDELWNDDQEHVVAVNSDEAHGNGSEVVEVVHGKELSLGLVTRNDIDDLNKQDEDLDDEQEDGGHEDEVEGAPSHGRGAARNTAHKWRGTCGRKMTLKFEFCYVGLR